MNLYNIFIEQYGRAAKNVGIICSSHPTKSDWSTGRLRWITNYRERENFLFAARDDQHAYHIISEIFKTRSSKPLAGRSYLRDCRVKLS